MRFQATRCHCLHPPPRPGKDAPSFEADTQEQLQQEVVARLPSCADREVLWLWLVPAADVGPWCLAGIGPTAPALQVRRRVEGAWHSAVAIASELAAGSGSGPQAEGDGAAPPAS